MSTPACSVSPTLAVDLEAGQIDIIEAGVVQADAVQCHAAARGGKMAI